MHFCRYCGAELEMPGADCLMCGEPDIRLNMLGFEKKKRPPLSKYEVEDPYLRFASQPADEVVVKKCSVITEDIDLTYKTSNKKNVQLGPTTLVGLSHYLSPKSCIPILVEWNQWSYDCIWAFKNGYPDHVGIWCQIAASVFKRWTQTEKIRVDYLVRALGSGELKLKGDEDEPLDLLCRAMAEATKTTTYAPSAIIKKHLMPQTKTLSRDERIEQIVEGEIYGCDKNALPGLKKTIVIVDDVCTSGSTLFGIREAILKVRSDATVLFFVIANNPGKVQEEALKLCQQQNAVVGRCFGTLMIDTILGNAKIHKLSFKDPPPALALLSKIEDAPKVVYCMGNLELLQSVKNVAVVGSRMCTVIGKKNAKSIGKLLAKNGYCVVSGLADGVDAAAHLGALIVADRTIAVVPSLTDLNDPILACEILKRGGLLLSENPPGTTTSSKLLVQRNRLQTGLSLATIVVEAEDKSGGTMATAQFSIDQGRPILCPHGSFYSSGALELAGVSEEEATLQTGGLKKLAKSDKVALHFKPEGLEAILKFLNQL